MALRVHCASRPHDLIPYVTGVLTPIMELLPCVRAEADISFGEGGCVGPRGAARHIARAGGGDLCAGGEAMRAAKGHASTLFAAPDRATPNQGSCCVPAAPIASLITVLLGIVSEDTKLNDDGMLRTAGDRPVSPACSPGENSVLGDTQIVAEDEALSRTVHAVRIIAAAAATSADSSSVLTLKDRPAETVNVSVTDGLAADTSRMCGTNSRYTQKSPAIALFDTSAGAALSALFAAFLAVNFGSKFHLLQYFSRISSLEL